MFVCLDSSEEGEGYTSLYEHNQYEEIQPEVKFEGLRSVKELLLKVGSYRHLHEPQLHLCLGAQARPTEADQARQGLLGGEEEASQECQREAGPGPGGHHTAGGRQGPPAVQHRGQQDLAVEDLTLQDLIQDIALHCRT